jgi:alpha-L-arabinofuranosidase
VLAGADIHDHNTFDRPATVRPREDRAAAVRDGVLEHTFPPASVTRLTLTM